MSLFEKKYDKALVKVLTESCRVLLGVVFVFSGLVKSIDPMGGGIKIAEYLTSFGLDTLRPFSVMFSFNLSAAEFALGVCVLLGVYRRYSSFLTLLFMIVFTPLTLYLALFDPVSDCGCFGDALVISNWESFFKNVVLLAASIYLFIHNQRVFNLYTFKVYWFVAMFAYMFCVGFAYRNYNHLPIKDFRPYKVGTNIPLAMSIPDGAAEDEYDYLFVYEKNGEKKEFSLENSPVNDSTWQFVESKTKLLKQGYVPPIISFNIYDADGQDATSRILDTPGLSFLLISPDLKKADDEHIDEINALYDYAQEKSMPFYCVVASSAKDVSTWVDNTGAEYPFLWADEVLLKTMIRSNPGLILLENGTILAKWHYNDFPQEEETGVVLNGYLGGNGHKQKEDASWLLILLTFAVPLSLVWVYDYFRYRRRGLLS